jgi:hypothetical protein
VPDPKGKSALADNSLYIGLSFSWSTGANGDVDYFHPELAGRLGSGRLAKGGSNWI